MTITKNKQALHDYQIIETYEAGIVLTGPEVRSIKLGGVQLKGSFCSIDANEELWLKHAHVAPYGPAAGVQADYSPTQPRKLLLQKKELSSLVGKLKTKGLTLLPLRIFTTRGFIKVEIGIGKGKKSYDKREEKKSKDIARDLKRELRKK